MDISAGLMLLSGAVHAGVNAVVKSGKDKISSRALLDGFSALIVLPFIFFVPLPHGAWGWLFASWAAHLVYLLCLIKAFEGADMSAAYPIMRGTAPLLSAVGATLLINEPITVPMMIGILTISIGAAALAFERHVPKKAMLWAVATGAMIATYTITDAQGVRAAPSVASYFVWVFVMLGGGIAAVFALWKGKAFVEAARSEWKPGLWAGAGSLLSYGLALYAYRLGDVARLAALRETSIVFGLIFAVIFLKEKVSAQRVIGACLIAVGAAILLLFR